MSKSTFYSLYRRGKYCPQITAHQDGVGRSQREDFATASLAFILQHADSLLRWEFLQRFADPEFDFGPADGISVELQQNPGNSQERWDLVLQRKHDWAVIFESKFGPNGPSEHQDPLNPTFKHKTGYGHLIKHEFPNTPHLYYVLLLDQPVADERTDQAVVNGIQCMVRRWKDLRDLRCGTYLLEDLCTSLGQLGFYGLRSMRTKETKIGKKAEVTWQAYGVLRDVMEELDVPERYYYSDSSYNPENWDGNWFCFSVKTKQSPTSGWLADVQRQFPGLPWGVLVSFGYDLNGPDWQPTLTVWVYTGSGKEERARAKRAWKGLPWQTREDDTEGGAAVYIRCPAEDTPLPDKEWFLKVLRALQHNKNG